MPFSQQQIALGLHPPSAGTLNWIRTEFMGKADNLLKVCMCKTLATSSMFSLTKFLQICLLVSLLKVYAPIWCDNHWFLMIIDTLKMELVYLDSHKIDQHTRSRILAMKRVVGKLELKHLYFQYNMIFKWPDKMRYPIISFSRPCL